ncbi:toxin-activating lysine-acyltransferase [Histidinibacterium lentulum]|uniref:RTX toxin-activating lysine-acyltransferase n=1 Tax=Histidinibacterium lentulum TaxID=2480588 RepID=A0A3N2QYE2_9RHOB|nr:toxin-activating lysine-acyltransferase [Histidinibacterium lentulum]ROU00220.1 toxin-activating lysine-acyltransferase [Histidinibacterium lentulum]
MAGKKEKPVAEAPALTEAEASERLARIRVGLRHSFAAAALAMIQLPRYRSQHLSDLEHLLLEPLLRDRVAFAYPKDVTEAGGLADQEIAGFAIWASVSPEVDGRIREQIAQGTWPIRLKAEDWTSGEIAWLFDVVAPGKDRAASVIAGFRKLVEGRQLHLHPLIARLVDRETLEKMGARRTSEADAETEDTPEPAS